MKDWDAQNYRQHTGFVSELGLQLVEILGPGRGERILDVGCGDGVWRADYVRLRVVAGKRTVA